MKTKKQELTPEEFAKKYPDIKNIPSTMRHPETAELHEDISKVIPQAKEEASSEVNRA